jgi:hypothetical protein
VRHYQEAVGFYHGLVVNDAVLRNANAAMTEAAMSI